MATPTIDLVTLYRARKGRVGCVDVPEPAVARMNMGGSFQDAIQALFAAAHAAHSIVKKQWGEAPPGLPLEALWWVAGTNPTDLEDADAASCRWGAYVVHPAPIDELTVAPAVEQASRKYSAGLQVLQYERWQKGRCAQTLHIGPYDAEGPRIAYDIFVALAG